MFFQRSKILTSWISCWMSPINKESCFVPSAAAVHLLHHLKPTAHRQDALLFMANSMCPWRQSPSSLSNSPGGRKVEFCLTLLLESWHSQSAPPHCKCLTNSICWRKTDNLWEKMCEPALNLNSLPLYSNLKKFYPFSHFDFIFDLLDEKFGPAGQMF